MLGLHFHQIGLQSHLYEVNDGEKIIGIVWRKGNAWHADPYNTTNPAITETTREAAAAKLKRR